MKWKEYLDESEEVHAIFSYEFKGVVQKTIGSTNKRNFCYEKVRNAEKFVTSQKAISYLEYGMWKVPWFAWVTIILDFVISSVDLFTSLDVYSILGFIPAVIFLGLAIYFRKFEYLISAVGSEKFHVISRRKSVLDEITAFIKKLHTTEQVGLNASEEYIVGNYYDRLINRFLFIITFEVSFFLWIAEWLVGVINAGIESLVILAG